MTAGTALAVHRCSFPATAMADPGGSAFLDECGSCVGGNTGLEACPADCLGVYGGTAYTDDCGVCDDDPSNDNTVDPLGASVT